ncbi:unnamed protein product [Strongylus vulgaris]|uniref:Uncharacterized protein n=1 Tax=Strongylus vulgaris TaxID=40348 RepID=A0A3P7IG38_STRVU|nr:unnamed protein product [Strongylus vulgaris]
MFRKHLRRCPPARKRTAETWSGPAAVAAFMVCIAAGFDTVMLSPEHDSREGPCGTSLDFSFVVLLPKNSIACTFDLLAKLYCYYWLPVTRYVL